MNLGRLLCCLLVTVLLSLPGYTIAEVIQVDNDELKALREQGVALIDVRYPEEWKSSGIIEGSHMLTFFDKSGRYNVRKWLADLQQIAPDDQPFVLICEVGGRTGSISKLLDKKLGFSQVHNLTKGIRHWISKGQKTVPYQPG